jgi:hypothetical protein
MVWQFLLTADRLSGYLWRYLVMAYLTPQFPLTCDVLRWNGVAYVLSFSSTCAFRTLDHNGRQLVYMTTLLEQAYGLIYLPKGTDVRSDVDRTVVGTRDIIVIPSGGHTWYRVLSVGDQAKGFPNEFRVAFVEQEQTSDGPHS